MKRLTLALAIPLAVSVAACDLDLESELGSDEIGDHGSAIIGGIEITTDPEIVFFATGGGACTGTLVGRRLVLTAAHCVSGTSGGTVSFGNSTNTFTDQVGIARSLPHRYYNDGVIARFDIAMIRLAGDAPAEVPTMGVNLDPLTSADIGRSVRVVGFGVTDGQAQTGAGTKRQVGLTLDSLTSEHIGLGDPQRNICQGDSGGPTIFQTGNDVLAVSSFGSNFCMDQSFVTRTDVHADFLRQVIASWGDDSPCVQDGNCVTSGCDFPDPDCDICGLDGVCGSGCEKLDLDCPVTGFAGDLCSDNDGCESRQCIEAADDQRVKYCSTACDDGDPTVAACAGTLSCVDKQCQYTGTTPSAQGSPCATNDQCRSNLCDLTNRICVEECSSDDECADPFACESVSGIEVCTVPVEGNCLGCGAGNDPAGQRGAAMLLILVAIGYGGALRRRRRRTREVRDRD